MTPDTDLREKDIAVLQAIQDGAQTVSQIKATTTLSNREINYSLTEKSLQQQGLVEIEREEGRKWTEFQNSERYIWKPKTVELTDKAITLLAEHQTNNRYEDLSKQELIQRIHELEQRQTRLENMFKDFRQKVMKRI